MPSEHGTTRFPCPNCGMIPIIRCERCRQLGNRYTCPNCGFT
ncbi:MAG: zinc finger domain-containing protein, partial [Candidatus Thorarchaeota archaeon]